jgi:nucleoside 2-deoxyribosyltransferase
MLVYLAGPIDAVSSEEARTWREQATEALTTERPNIATFSPVHAITVGRAAINDESTAESIIQINQLALARADFVLANLDGPSFGTPIECLEATVPVIGFGNLARMQKSVYQHRFAHLALACEEAVRVLLLLFKEAEAAEPTP